MTVNAKMKKWVSCMKKAHPGKLPEVRAEYEDEEDGNYTVGFFDYDEGASGHPFATGQKFAVEFICEKLTEFFK